MVDMSQMALTLAEGDKEPCLMRKLIRLIRTASFAVLVDLGIGNLRFVI